ncbi:D-alanyl-D-alanine carboxypeptidase family protein [Caldalkalibacillus salinus]|uniref:D-alanyl-D-alanine carboxypeptidase family protein n=1 Tax=Caldalkalibacillus salinus TaxID=2803787 RepID=UPI0019228875|nr:D-alanyl-D-alanine carboxypeptidase family protein [Caldalkalibacillus salinus]
MLKRISLLICTTLIIQTFMQYGTPVVQAEEEVDLTPDARSAVLMDMDTGTILYEKDSDKRLPPASITKIMTMLLIMEAIDEGQLKWTDMVRTSERAASMGGSQIFLEVGEEMSVEDMMKGIAIASGNDATVAMAEHIAGTEDKFVQKMNEKAQTLGLENTHFSNTNGLPTEDHYTSARDIAIMSRELLKYEDITKFTSVYEDYLRQDSDKPFWLVNTNRLVKFYDGVDGLKTGYTNESKYCLAATAKRGDMRVISVVMGAPKPKVRNQYTADMLTYAFNQFETHPIYKKGDVLDAVTIDKGAKSKLDMVVPHQVSVLTRKGDSLDDYDIAIEPLTHLQAPITEGDVIGHIRIRKEGQVTAEIAIKAPMDVSKASLLQMFNRVTKSLFGLQS